MRRIPLSSLVLVALLAACSETPETNDTGAANRNAAPINALPPTLTNRPTASTGAVSDPNPPHGEPGHRCEIPVGASLSGTTPAAGPVDQMPSSQTITMPQTTIQPSSGSGGTSPGINPPHGEPGHDCAVPVGSPLPAK